MGGRDIPLSTAAEGPKLDSAADVSHDAPDAAVPLVPRGGAHCGLHAISPTMASGVLVVLVLVRSWSVAVPFELRCSV